MYNAKELDRDTNLYYYGARYYDPKVSVFLNVDPLAEKAPDKTPYHFVSNNPINRIDPDGALDYPIITITKEMVWKAVDQRVIGYSDGKTTQVDLYKAIVTDTEDANFKMEFLVTRDAWVDPEGNGIARNVAFEPKEANDNRYIGVNIKGGYPSGNGTSALKLNQKGSEVIHAESNQISVDMGYRIFGKDVAAGVMIHVGGNYEKEGSNRIAASEGCFGVSNPNNSSMNQSNDYSNKVMNSIKSQAAKSKTNPGKIEIIIQKRTGNEFPDNKKY